MLVQHPVKHHRFARPLRISHLTVTRPACTSCLLLQAQSPGGTEAVGACLAGSVGKTTTSWLIRGIFEEWGKLTGMAGTIENAIYADKLDEEGNLWTPDEPDPTLDRRAPTTAA